MPPHKNPARPTPVNPFSGHPAQDSDGLCAAFAAMTAELFDPATVLGDSPRLQSIKAHNIQTLHAPHQKEPWMAIPMSLAHAALEENLPAAAGDIGAILLRRLDAMGLVFRGQSENDVQDDALARCLRP